MCTKKLQTHRPFPSCRSAYTSTSEGIMRRYATTSLSHSPRAAPVRPAAVGNPRPRAADLAFSVSRTAGSAALPSSKRGVGPVIQSTSPFREDREKDRRPSVNSCAHASRPSPFHRLEADLEPMSGRLGEARERAGRRLAAPTFEPRDRALRRLHALGKLGLTQARALPRLGDFQDQRELFLQRVIFLPIGRILHPSLMQVGKFRHVTSLALCAAISISRRGVFCVFFTNTRTTTTRCPLAVT